MADATVASLHASLTIETKEARKQLRDAGVDLRRLKGDLRKFETEEERQIKTIKRWDAALRAKLITDKQHALMLDRVINKTRQLNTVQRRGGGAFAGGLRTVGGDIGLQLAGGTAAGSALSRFGPVGLGLGAAIGGAGMAFRAGIRTNERTVAMADQADVAGTSAAGLAAFQSAGARRGISNEQMSAALARNRKRVSEAAAGMGEAQKALAEMGLSARELNELDAEESNLRQIEALRTQVKETDRLRLAVKIWGDDARNMVNLLDLSRDEFDRFKDSWSEALSPEKIVEARELSAAWASLGDEISRMTMTLTADNVAALKEAVNLMRDFVELATILARLADDFSPLLFGLRSLGKLRETAIDFGLREPMGGAVTPSGAPASTTPAVTGGGGFSPRPLPPGASGFEGGMVGGRPRVIRREEPSTVTDPRTFGGRRTSRFISRLAEESRAGSREGRLARDLLPAEMIVDAIETSDEVGPRVTVKGRID